MKNAQDARKETASNVNEFNVQKEVLMRGFTEQIDIACKNGEYSVKDYTFPLDRFRADVIDSVLKELKYNGYTTDVIKQNAMQTISFTVKWNKV